MKIAEIAPLFEPVPSKKYGGTERIVGVLAEALLDLGHEVTVYASGDSQTRARLKPMCDRGLRQDPEHPDPYVYHMLMLEEIARDAGEYDLLHFHTDYVHFPLARRLKRPHLTTLHGRLDLEWLNPLYEEFRDIPLVSISDSQRTPIPKANWVRTIPHGLPTDALEFHPKPGQYLAFLGRFTPEKQADVAISIAKRSGWPIKLAAKIDDEFLDYFKEKVEPHFGDSGVEYLGEISWEEKGDFLGNAAALLFPIDWPEPFGLVMIEALACGCPVIAFHEGDVEEVLRHNETAFLVQTEDEAVEAVNRLDELDRQVCRREFEERFSVERMARDYAALFEETVRAAGKGERVA